jgi:hypothetical protein
LIFRTTAPGKFPGIQVIAFQVISFAVRIWGNVADGTVFTRQSRPGQVLFGKRRAYQRKVAVAEFEAVGVDGHHRQAFFCNCADLLD